MENRDESRRALAVAKRAFEAGDIAKAVRLAEKALNMYPEDETRLFLQKCKRRMAGDQPTPKPRPRPSASAPTPPSPSSQPSFTAEQAAKVKAVNRKKDYYEILGISRDATPAQVKKAYHKLSLLVHPDKNSAPGSDEAFKAVSRAYACLSDAQKRRVYDQTGTDMDNAPPPQQRHPFHGHGMYGEEISPEDLFNAFFGGGFAPRGGGFRTHHYQQRPRRQQRSQRSQEDDPVAHVLRSILQMLPILLLFSFAFLGSDETPEFSLHASRAHPIARYTRNLGVPYYVDADFEGRYDPDPSALKQLEDKIERRYMAEAQSTCHWEEEQRRRVQQSAEFYTGPDREAVLRRARAQGTPACSHLRDLKLGRHVRVH